MVTPCEAGIFSPGEKDPSKQNPRPVYEAVPVSTLDRIRETVRRVRGSSVAPDSKGILILPTFNDQDQIVGGTMIPVSERILDQEIDEADTKAVFMKSVSPKEAGEILGFRENLV